MPSERFCRLSAVKKQIIRQAAVREFARVPFEKVSINRIIQTADISRGSFYTYFEDKKDLLRWLFEDSTKNFENRCRASLEQTGGDYFAMLEDLFDYAVRQFDEAKEMLQVARNVFSNSETAEQLGFRFCSAPEECFLGDGPETRVFSLISREGLRFGSPEEFAPLATLGGIALLVHLKQYYDSPENVEQIRARFGRTLDMLRYGSCKNRPEAAGEPLQKP